MVFSLQKSAGNEESRRLGIDRCWLEGRDKEEHPTDRDGMGVPQPRTTRTMLPAEQKQVAALQAPSAYVITFK